MPSLQWFTLNRENGGPAYFGESNRTVAAFYWNNWLFGVVLTVAAFLTVLIILSPAFKYKWKTLSLVTTDLLMGGAILLALVMPWWMTSGSVNIRATVKSQETLDLDLTLTVNIGLDHVNITLLKFGETSSIIKRPIILHHLMSRGIKEQPAKVQTHIVDFQFNEKVELLTREAMKNQFKKALQKGLPTPILTVMQYFCHQEEGFKWSYHFRQAGYYCEFVLTLTLICWAWMNVFFIVIPRYGAIAMITMGLLGLLSAFIYWILLPPRDLVIRLNGSTITFHLDGCYWTVLSTGFVALVTGTALYFIDWRYPGSLIFDLELENELATGGELEAFNRSLYRLQPAGPASKKLILLPRSSMIDSSGNIISKPKKRNKQDSGISTTESDSNLAVLSKVDTTSVLEQIATCDGSYFRSTVTNLIHTYVPKIYSYTFRHGRELPSFHESTISLNSDTIPRYLESVTEDTAMVHQTGGQLCRSKESLLSSSDDDWQDPLEDGESNVAVLHINSEDLEETFCSTLSTTHPNLSMRVEPSPRRRTHRIPSIGSHLDIVSSP